MPSSEETTFGLHLKQMRESKGISIREASRRTAENKFGEYLRKLRGKKSLRTVSEEAGISHTYLSTLEKGYDPRTQKGRKPNPEILKKLAKSLEVDYEELMFAAGYIAGEDENKFGEYLRELRRKKNLSLKGVAEQGGCSHSYLSQLETGKRGTPKPETIKALAKGLSVEYEDLMKAAGYIEEEPGGNKKVLEGTAFVTEIECHELYMTYGDALCESGYLTEEVEKYAGKRVRITIEEID